MKGFYVIKKLSLVIPCYNEEKTLAACVERVLAIKDESLELELIIVDDGSKDESLEIAAGLAAAHPEVKVVKHAINQGKGAALRTGLIEARGDFVGIQDADNEYNPQDYKILLQPILEGKADVVYGSRYLRPDTRRVLYFWHSMMNRVLTFCSNAFTDLGITDMETCYKLFRRDVIQELAPNLKENRFGFEPEITMLVAERRCRVYECAISYNPRTYDEGKKIGWKDGMRALYCILHYGAFQAPLPMQFLIYFIIGALSAMLNISLFTLFFRRMDLFSANMSAFAIAVAFNYLLCIAILFKHRARWSAKREIVLYVLCVCVIAGLDYSFTLLLLYSGMNAVAAKTISAFCCFGANFLIRKYLIF